MPYVINNSRGQLIAIVQDGTINTTSTTQTLVGKDVSPYGELEMENLVRQLENFANATPPENPIQGQIWYDTSSNILYFYTITNAWKPVKGATASAVGRRLKFLAEKLQIFVVTHQPQIASQASQHFRISKIMVTNQQNQQVVNTVIEKLDDETRKNEIARMLSGDEVSEEALAVAKQLIQS
jgi:hypothetical protein